MKTTKTTPRSKALKSLQKLVRLKAADDNGYCECVTCGKMDKWHSMDGGHFISKGHSSYWSLREENVHPQCKACNGWGMTYGTSQIAYTKWMIDFYGESFLDYMLETKKDQVKFYKKDYLEMTKDLNEQITYHLKRIGHE